ncbi:MAG: hypothetical protein WCA35_14340 [Kovacikia sp.]
MEYIEFPPPAEFEDRFGEIRPIPTCSAIGATEFEIRLQQIPERLQQIAKDGETWRQAYRRDKRLRFLIQRCLTLNGIDPETVTLGQVEVMLLHRWDEETDSFKPGWLVELNGLEQKSEEAPSKQDPLTLSEIIAILSLPPSNLKEGLELASVFSARNLMPILAARAELLNPEVKERAHRKRVMRKLKPNYQRLMAIPTEKLKEVYI